MKGRTIVLMLTLIILTAGFVAAQPLGANVTDTPISSRYNDTINPQSVDALAGNVTEISLSSIAVTKSWQGFFGNITGEIILANAAGANFYNWNISTPTGQVYASRNNTLTWTGVACMTTVEIAAEETYLNQTSTEIDSVTNTFNANDHPAFSVGTANIEVNTCNSTQTYNASGEQGDAFYQVLLSDGDSNTIYTTIIEDTTPEGFDGRPWHFQLLVGERGKDNTEVTPYYFYIELR